MKSSSAQPAKAETARVERATAGNNSARVWPVHDDNLYTEKRWQTSRCPTEDGGMWLGWHTNSEASRIPRKSVRRLKHSRHGALQGLTAGGSTRVVPLVLEMVLLLLLLMSKELHGETAGQALVFSGAWPIPSCPDTRQALRWCPVTRGRPWSRSSPTTRQGLLIDIPSQFSIDEELNMFDSDSYNPHFLRRTYCIPLTSTSLSIVRTARQ